MTKQVQRRRGTATQHTSFTGAEGELSVNTTNKSVHVHDNVTAGGFEAARADMDNVTSSSILTAAGITATTTELNYVDGVTSAIQTQIDGKAGTASPTFTGTLTTANLTATGTTTLAGASTSADITFGDNDKAVFGAGSDLQIYHDPSGPSSLISDQGAGDLILRGSNQIRFQDATGAEHYAIFNENGGVQLYYDNSAKLATTSTGIDVTGTVTADGLTVDTGGTAVEFNHSANGPTLRFNNTDQTVADGQQLARIEFSTDDAGSTTDEVYLQLTGDGTGGAAFFDIMTGDGTPTTTARFNVGGDISFYDSSGSSQAFFWDASAESLGIGTSSPQARIDSSAVSNFSVTYNDFTGDGLHIQSTGTAGDGAYAGGISFSRISADNNSRAAGIAAVQTGSDADRIGLAFFTHPDATTSNDLAEAMRIASDGSVGIGTSSPSANLEISGSSNQRIDVIRTSGPTNRLSVTSDKAYVGAVTNHPLLFIQNDTERMRLDASGNLLVGTTDNVPGNGDTNTGVAIGGTGYIAASAGGTNALNLNRNTSDGDIAVFRKDGTTVGSIGNIGSAPVFRNVNDDGVTILTDDGIARLVSTNSSGIADNDGTLGTSSYRWKDLYLSGGVFLGGTGSSNKLEDYEEGTWTPSVSATSSSPSSISYSERTGIYTKIGNLVTLQCELRISSKSGGSGGATITGMPFACKSVDIVPVGPMEASFINLSTGYSMFAVMTYQSQSTIFLRQYGDSVTESSISIGSVGSSSRIRFTLTYQTQ